MIDLPKSDEVSAWLQLHSSPSLAPASPSHRPGPRGPSCSEAMDVLGAQHLIIRSWAMTMADLGRCNVAAAGWGVTYREFGAAGKTSHH